MQNEEIGKRLRKLRGERTQQAFADLIGISRSYLGVLEAGQQGPSRSVLKSLKEKLGANSDWVLYGEEKNVLDSGAEEGKSAAAALLKESGQAGKTAPGAVLKGAREVPGVPLMDLTLQRGVERMLGFRETPVRPLNKKKAEGLVVNDIAVDKAKEAGGPYGAARSPGAKGKPLPPEGGTTSQGAGWGYAELATAQEVRFKALKDKEVVGTGLWEIVADDELWSKAAQEIEGWEMEVLRAYLAVAGDREVVGFMEVLNFIRLMVARDTD